MKKIIYLLPIFFGIFACGAQQPQPTQNVTDIVTITFTAIAQTPIALTTTPIPNTPIPKTQISSRSNYNNPKYEYSLDYPNFYDVVIVNNEYVEIGEKIVVEVMNVNPTVPRGDGFVIENAMDVQLSGYSAKLLTGYVGSVGGYIPQQFRRYVVERNGSYFVVTLYAIGLHATEGDVSQITQLIPEDIATFDSIVTSMQIP